MLAIEMNTLKLTTIAITLILSMFLMLWVLVPWFKKQNGRRWAWVLLIAGLVYPVVYSYWFNASGEAIAEMMQFANGIEPESSPQVDAFSNVYYIFFLSFAVFYRKDRTAENAMFLWLANTSRFIGLASIYVAAAAFGVGSNYLSVSQPEQLPRWALMVAAMLALTYGLLRACCWLMGKLEGRKKIIYVIDALIAVYLIWDFWPTASQPDQFGDTLAKGIYTGNSTAVFTGTMIVLEDAAVVALVFVIAALVMKNIYDEKERAVLAQRAELVERMYAGTPSDDVILPRR